MNLIELSDLKVTFPKFTFVLENVHRRTSMRFEFDQQTQAALTLVLISLKGYYEAPNPVLEFHNLRLWSVSFTGSAYLKKIRKKSIVNYLNGIMYDEPSWWNETPCYQINEIGDIFNYQYCFPWEAVDENDYLISQTPVKESKKKLNKFRVELREILNQMHDAVEIKDLEVLLNLSSSVAINEKGKRDLHYLAKSSSLHFSEKRKAGKRCFLTTAPGDGRDAIINSVDDLNTIQYIEMQLDSILRNDFTELYLVHKNEEIFQNRLKEFVDKNQFFLMRDIKKEGITKPKALLKIMLEELYLRFKCKAFKNVDFFEGPWYENDKGRRGHGLGMANTLTSLMQITLFRILEKKIFKLGIEATVDMICHNDDIIIGISCESLDEAEDVLNFDCEILEDLDIIVSRDKSFLSNIGGILCERYLNRGVGLHKKESYRLREINLIYTACNVCHAKSIISSLYKKFEMDIDLREIISYFGYEFFPRETELPISIGGWKRDKSFKCSFELKALEEHWSNEVFRMYLASKHNKASIKRKKKVQKYLPPLIKLFPIKGFWEKVPEEVKENLCIFSSRLANQRFTRLKKFPKERLVAWENLREERKKTFNTPAPNIPRDLLFEEIMKKNVNIFPPDSFISRWVDIKVIDKVYKDFTNLPNPITSALSKLNLVKDDEVIPCFWPLLAKTHDNINKASERKELARIINFVPPVFLYEEKDTVLPKDPNDFRDFWLSYPAPLLMGKVCEVYGKVPILKEKYFKNKDIDAFELTEENLHLYQLIPHKYFKFFMEVKKEKNIDYSYCLEMIDKIFMTPKQKVIQDLSYYSSSEESNYDLSELLSDVTPKYLSWEDSWEEISKITEYSATMFEDIFFKVDPDMRKILDEIKQIYLGRLTLRLISDPEEEAEQRELEREFRAQNPEFADLFEIFVETANDDVSNSSDIEGGFGDFNLDDF